MTTLTKKLIEVALPLEAINKEAAREKSIRHGHPSTLHLWWARRPLAAARAVIFAQMVDDPSSVPEEFPTIEEQEAERQRLFRLIEDMVKWENTTNEHVLEQARTEIRRSWARWCEKTGEDPEKLPPFHDPFAGGGALPLEAQRLGLEAHASDLNPVAVMINKAMIEIPPRFAGKAPVNPKSRKGLVKGGYKGAAGLAEDVRYYGEWTREEAEKRIGHLFPKVKVTDDMAKDRPDLKTYTGREMTVIAWLWARTVESPNPAYRGCQVPLVSSFWLSTKKGKETWVEPIVDGTNYRFDVRTGNGAPSIEETINRQGGICLLSKSPMPFTYIREQGKAGNMGVRLMAIVAEGDRGRVYLSPTPEMEAIALTAQPEWRPEVTLPVNPRDFKTPNYGLATFADLFTSRQLVALTTFSDLVGEASEKVKADAIKAGMPADSKPLRDGGFGASAYSEAICVYLACILGKATDYNSSICSWISGGQTMRNTFGRQAIPMIWDYAEANILSQATGSFNSGIDQVVRVVNVLPANMLGFAEQADAQNQCISKQNVVSTDPPYYDNIGYADLSDFFYMWMRRSLKSIFPDLFATVAVPKTEELVATPYRHGSKERAEHFFLNGMTKAMNRLAEQAHSAFPVTIYYAFKQSEVETDTGTASTGWETFLEAVIRAGFAVSGTWPMRTELANKVSGIGRNMLASSIVLVCRQRSEQAVLATRREFLATLKQELLPALQLMQQGNVAPVDLAQASIGPGMAIFSRYAKILEADGSPMRVRMALALINQTLDEVLAEQESDFEPDTRWAVAWFDQYGFNDAPFGEAETLCKAKNTSVDGLQDDGILVAKAGRVRLLRIDELPDDWDPVKDKRRTVWEQTHYLIRALNQSESAAAALLAKIGGGADAARELAYRLYNICERRKRAQEAQNYNALVLSWPEIIRLSQERRVTPAQQDGTLF
jgi:putative DNA methylase